MRLDPLTLNEQVALTKDLLTEFGYAEEILQSSTSRDGKRTERKQWHIHDKRNADRSMKIAEAFIEIVNDENNQPATLDDAINDVRYKMGYGWLAWLLVRNFAIPVIKWLWNRYHNSIPLTKAYYSIPAAKLDPID